ncbi:MAG: dihydrofolate reductase [Bacteroidetes bacterium]|nr:dihydrofolate reductase [Bacteroidota bacterium]
MKISIIAAIGKNNELGAGNSLLWHLSDDLKTFKKITSGHCIIMGRKTFESIGKALKGRINIVVTTRNIEVADIYTAVDLNHAIEIARETGDEEVFIIGGGQIYNYAIDLADRLYLTFVDAEFKNAEVFFPDLNYEEWQLLQSENFNKNENNEFNFVFKVFERKSSI